MALGRVSLVVMSTRVVGAEHALFALAPLHTMSDRRDLGSASHPLHPDIASPAIIVYEALPHGIGITRKLLQLRKDWFSSALALARGCPCSDGCPSCVYIPRRKWGTSVLSKAGGVVILSLLCEAPSEAHHSQRPGSPG